ncbi:DUF1674 domain-containing protein [Elongatibacter sediminis]|uniref:Succinate dehydrogenase assembly factor 4 n=1 Tax=Elongatibacter sediminis TaxID=3119006 RepID=A0AAW9RFV3_9GAMM
MTPEISGPTESLPPKSRSDAGTGEVSATAGKPESPAPNSAPPKTHAVADHRGSDNAAVREIGGRKGPEPTRYGDWEKNGRCTDF